MYEIWTDGSCKYNPGAGAYSLVVIKENRIIYYYNESTEETTNNREELKAMIHALQYVLDNELTLDNEVIIYSDSSYVVNTCNDWIFRWANNYWCNSKGNQVENIDLIQTLYKYINIKIEKCQIVKCKGHDGNIGNELADALAQGNAKKFEKYKEILREKENS